MANTYLRRSLIYLVLSIALFFAAFFGGYAIPLNGARYSASTAVLLTQGAFNTFLHVLHINLRSFLLQSLSFATVGLGDMLLLVQNGAQLGALTHRVGWLPALLTVAPHGTLEMGAILLNSAITLATMQTLGESVLQGTMPRPAMLRWHLFLFLIALGMLVMAAYIEAYITPQIVIRCTAFLRETHA